MDEREPYPDSPVQLWELCQIPAEILCLNSEEI